MNKENFRANLKSWLWVAAFVAAGILILFATSWADEAKGGFLYGLLWFLFVAALIFVIGGIVYLASKDRAGRKFPDQR